MINGGQKYKNSNYNGDIINLINFAKNVMIAKNVKMDHSRTLFNIILVFSIGLTVKNCFKWKFANDWSRTADLWSRKRPLCQMSPLQKMLSRDCFTRLSRAPDPPPPSCRTSSFGLHFHVKSVKCVLMLNHNYRYHHYYMWTRSSVTGLSYIWNNLETYSLRMLAQILGYFPFYLKNLFLHKNCFGSLLGNVREN